MKEKKRKCFSIHDKILHTQRTKHLELLKSLGRRAGITISPSSYAVVKLTSGVSNNQQSLCGRRSNKMKDEAWAQTRDTVYQLNCTA